jgi:hypothetical protein
MLKFLQTPSHPLECRKLSSLGVGIIVSNPICQTFAGVNTFVCLLEIRSIYDTLRHV